MRRTRNQVREDPEYLRLKNMIQFFRVSELQSLLESVSANKLGRKIELQNRVIDLLKTNMTSSIKEKIREIYNQAQGRSASPITISDSQSSTTSSTTAAGGASVALTQQNANRTESSTATATINQRSQAGAGNHNLISNPSAAQTAVVQPTLAEHYGRQMAHPSPAIIYPRNISGLPRCSDVRLRPLPFYDILATLIRPSTLLPSSTLKQQDITFPLHLTPSQVSEISSNRTHLNDETTIQVQLRFCLGEITSEQDDAFPPGIQVRVNNKFVMLPNPIPTNKPGVEPKRPPRPVDITQHIRLSATVTNTIHIQWNTEYNRSYVTACYLVRRLMSQDLLSRLKIKGVKPSEYTRGLIKEKLREDADSEIATTLLKVSLNCPLGKMRMTTPCRSSTCSHLQCFDASLYLQMNEKKPTWMCPVCDQQARYENLVIDGYFQAVLKSANLTLDDSEIQLHKDGSWSTHRGKTEPVSLDTPNRKTSTNSQIEVISDDLEVVAMDPPKTGIKIFNASKSNKRPAADVVDLTCSDSDEDDDIPLKKLMTQTSSTPSGSSINKKGHDKNKVQSSSDSSSSAILLDSPSPPSTPSVSSSSTACIMPNVGAPTSVIKALNCQKTKGPCEISSSTDITPLQKSTSTEPMNLQAKKNTTAMAIAVESSKSDDDVMTVEIEPDTVLLPANILEGHDHHGNMLPLDVDPFHNIDYENLLSSERIPQQGATSSTSED